MTNNSETSEHNIQTFAEILSSASIQEKYNIHNNMEKATNQLIEQNVGSNNNRNIKPKPDMRERKK